MEDPIITLAGVIRSLCRVARASAWGLLQLM